MFTAAGDQDLFRFVVQAVVTFELGYNGLLERRCAIDRGITGEAVIDGLDGGAADMLRCTEIRLAGTQPDDVAAFGAQLGDTRGYCQGR